MPTPAGRRRALTAAATAALLLAGPVGCGDETGAAAPAGAAVPGPPGPATPSGSPSPPASASASGAGVASQAGAAPASAAPSVPPRATASAPAPPSSARVTTAPAAPTRLTVAVETRSGRLALVRGGPAQEFTVTLRNGNSASYGHLLVAFQMEFLPGGPGDRPGTGPGFQLERFDQASGSWRSATLRIANDALPEALFTGGTPLARDSVRVERYRLRATAGGPTGSSPVVVSFIDTDTDRQVAGHVSLPHGTR
ncbi:hypothetical protein ACFWUZ_08075 [Streptomyces sp. NPDC058646]|uniref:hypothetical protein n=1 Tax=Streptomyces sp. NPDC058646 TaxID=3346574 RepID=UPI00364AF8BC